MNYFNSDFLKFFTELSNNNSKEWFDKNRKIYEKEVKKPFSDFTEEMIVRIKKFDHEIQINASDAILRINRDIRFSKDKTPYNTYTAAIFSKFGKKDKSYPGLYIRLSHQNVMIFGGVYMAENQIIENIRNNIASAPETFAAVYSDLRFKEKFGQIQGEQSKRLPSGFQSVLANEPLIANKQFYYSATLPSKIIISKELADTIIEYYLAGKKVNDFLKMAW
jgi:uncharacterized protein (TIGR02453 family)